MIKYRLIWTIEDYRKSCQLFDGALRGVIGEDAQSFRDTLDRGVSLLRGARLVTNYYELQAEQGFFHETVASLAALHDVMEQVALEGHPVVGLLNRWKVFVEDLMTQAMPQGYGEFLLREAYANVDLPEHERAGIRHEALKRGITL